VDIVGEDSRLVCICIVKPETDNCTGNGIATLKVKESLEVTESPYAKVDVWDCPQLPKPAVTLY